MMHRMKNLKLLNLNCRQASRLISEAMDRKLSFMERLGLRLHLMICTACRAWRRQVLLIRRAMRSQAREAGRAPETDATLTAEARRRIRIAIQARS
jgi:predicted anti-sigma-YlaC factor YlaD